MPLGPFEREVLRLLASNRNPDSFVAGATVLHQAHNSPRISKDIDFFHDTAGSILDSVAKDTAVLIAHGYEVEIPHPQPTFQRGFIQKGTEQTKIEWGHPQTPHPQAPDFGLLVRHYGSVKGAWPKLG